MIKFLSRLGVYKGEKLVETAAPLPLEAKTALTRLGKESNWVWITGKGNSFHAALILCTHSINRTKEER